MKRFIVMLITLLFITALASGCNAPGAAGQPAGPGGPPAGGGISIVCTIFPQYDWVRQILGDEATGKDLTLLQGSKVDLHNYQPSVADIVKLSTCDLFIYIGGESDKWADAALKQSENPNMVTIRLMDLLGESEKHSEGAVGIIQDEDDHDDGGDDHDDDHDDGGDDHGDGDDHDDSEDHDDDHDDGDDDHGDDHGDDHDDGGEHHHSEFDEHVWLSLRNAAVFCKAIADEISALDPGNAGTYAANLAAYLEKLSALDDEYREVVSAASTRVLLFGDRFPFRYLAEDYGLEFYAAFPGCSAETEASFQTIVTLAERVDEHNLRFVMVTESTDQSIARTIISNTASGDQRILVLDSMQSATTTDLANGKNYLSLMESNLNVLREALN